MNNGTIIAKNLLHKKLRFVLMLVSTVIAFLLYGLLMSFQSSLTGGDSAAGADRLIVTNKINFTQPLPISYVEQVREVSGVGAATHAIWFGGYYQEPRNFVVSQAVDIKSYFSVFTELEISTADLQSCKNMRNGIIVGDVIANLFGWEVGQVLPLQSSLYRQADGRKSWEFVICGIFRDKQERGTDNSVLFSYDYLNETRQLTRDTTGVVTLTLDDPSMSSEISNAIDAKFANSQAETDTVTEQQFAAAFASQFGDLKLMIGLIVGAAFTTILMILGTNMAMTVRERSREIGILKTLGFSNRGIISLFLGESLIIAAIGGFLGLTLAYLILAGLSTNPQLAGIQMTGRVWLTGAMWIALLGLATGIMPAIQALRIQIVTALARN